MRFHVFFVLIIMLSITFSVRANNAEDQKFNRLVEEYLDFKWKLSPLSATFNGIHTYDDQIDGFSIAEAQKELELDKQFVGRFQKEIDRSKLSESNQIDYDLIFQSQDAREFGLNRSRDLERDPSVYPNVLAGIGFLMFS